MTALVAAAVPVFLWPRLNCYMMLKLENALLQPVLLAMAMAVISMERIAAAVMVIKMVVERRLQKRLCTLEFPFRSCKRDSILC